MIGHTVAAFKQTSNGRKNEEEKKIPTKNGTTTIAKIIHKKNELKPVTHTHTHLLQILGHIHGTIAKEVENMKETKRERKRERARKKDFLIYKIELNAHCCCK